MKSKDQLLLEEAYEATKDLAIINELFETSKKIRWQIYGTRSQAKDYIAEFKAPNRRKYEIRLTKLHFKSLTKEAIRSYKGNKEEKNKMFNDLSSYYLEFGDLELGAGITGEGSGAAVFGIVMNAVVDLVKSEPKIARIFLEAKEESRRSLYSRLVPLLARKLGNWKLQVSKNLKYYYLERPEL